MKKSKVGVLKKVVGKIVKNGIKATAGYLQGDDLKKSGRGNEPDPTEFNEEDAWGDVKRAKHDVIKPTAAMMREANNFDNAQGDNFSFNFNSNEAETRPQETTGSPKF